MNEQTSRFYGIKELSDFIGWDKAKTHVYWKRGKIEDPAAYVGNRPLWTFEQVERIKKVVKT